MFWKKVSINFSFSDKKYPFILGFPMWWKYRVLLKFILMILCISSMSVVMSPIGVGGYYVYVLLLLVE